MYATCVTIFVKKENVEEFVKATLDIATNSRKEPGNIRYDVLRANDDETRFFPLRGLQDSGRLLRTPED